ncbi:MAG: response regulator transcription factor [Chloroflexota bacterium]
MHKKNILIVEDDAMMAELAVTIFMETGANIQVVSNGQEGLKTFYETQPDLVMVDIGLPEMNGWQLCERIREISQVPIIIVTAKDDPPSIIRGLELGADDFISKPYSPGVLLARAKAALRRSPTSGDNSSLAHPNQDRYQDERLTIDSQAMQAQVSGVTVKLSQTEWRLLQYFIRNADRILPTSQILQAVWGPEYQNDTQYVYTYIHRLRQKLEVDPNEPQYLLSEHGIGFRFSRTDSFPM